MREDGCGTLEFAHKVWEELLCYMHVRAESDVLAEHLVQDVLVKAARRTERLTDPLMFRVWLYQIATAVIAERLRHGDKADGHEPLFIGGSTAEIVGCLQRLSELDGRQESKGSEFSEVLELVALLDIKSSPKRSAATGREGVPSVSRERGGVNSKMRSARFALLVSLINACKVRMESESTSPPTW